MDGFLVIVLLILLAVFISIIVFNYIAQRCYPKSSTSDEEIGQDVSLVDRKTSAWRLENFGSWHTLSGSCYAEYPPDIDIVRENSVTQEDDVRRISVSSRGSRKRSFSREISRDTVDTTLPGYNESKPSTSMKDKCTLEGIAEDTDEITEDKTGRTDLKQGSTVNNSKERRKGGVTQSVYELEYCDPVSVGALININKVEARTKDLQEQVDNFAFTNRGIEYYKLVEKILRLKIDLYAVDCTQMEVKSRRNSVIRKIDEYQIILNSKSDEVFPRSCSMARKRTRKALLALRGSAATPPQANRSTSQMDEKKQGTGEKGFKTLELRLIGPTLIACGLVCCLIRVLLCAIPSSKCCQKKNQATRLKKDICPHSSSRYPLTSNYHEHRDPDFVKMERTSLLNKSKKKVSIVPPNHSLPSTSTTEHKDFQEATKVF
ncbi:unnamed protein product [Callosobruchus maculatus]|uniref:BAG domain-containing protein n=1 Tax=Callosobruchus maculatus TaxID=64391 RepID=A0A653DPG6_CALMS|nr:unnamed protein product [Callosobruchus maculatus]